MKFGLDRLLASRALRKGLRGKRVALLAHPASVTHDLTHALDALAALPDLELRGRVRAAARPARRQAGQHGRVGGFHGSRARHSGVQSLRRRAPADRDDDERRSTCCSSICRTSVAASTPSLRRCATCSKRRRGTARRCGFSIGRIPSAGPSRACAAAGLGELRRRRPAADAPRPHDGRARALVRRDAAVSRSTTESSRCRAGSPTPRPATAGRSASAAWINPSPNVPMLVVRALLSRHRHGRGHDVVGRPRHDAAVRAHRRARSRCRGAHRHDARARAAVAARLHAARVLVRADVPEARRQALRRRADSRRGRVRTRTRRFGRGAGRRSRSRRCARSSRSIRCGAISPTSTSAAGSRSTSSTAATCCAAGSTIGAARPTISTRTRAPTSGRGRGNASRSCSTEHAAKLTNRNVRPAVEISVRRSRDAARHTVRPSTRTNR